VTDADAALVSIAASTPAAGEPGSNGQFTVTMTNPSSTNTLVSYTVTGTAAAGVDYTALSGTVTVLANTTTALIDVTVLDDNVLEGLEDVTVQLTGIVTGDPQASIDAGNDTAVVTISDEDTALVSIAATTPAAEPAVNGQFTVTMTNPSATATTLTYTVTGTATAGVDYTALTGTVTVAANATTAFIDVTVLDDSLVEVLEGVTVQLTGVSVGDADASIDGFPSTG